MENKITLHIPEVDALAAAVNRLADALGQPVNAAAAGAETVPMTAPAVPMTAPAVPVTAPTVPVTAPAVPVAPAPAYTLEQLSLAARQLADAGRMADVQQLVAQFGAQTMAALPPERYGEFATALRGMGARI